MSIYIYIYCYGFLWPNPHHFQERRWNILQFELSFSWGGWCNSRSTTTVLFFVYIYSINLVGLQQGSLAYESKMQGLRLRLISVIFWVNGLAETSGQEENNWLQILKVAQSLVPLSLISDCKGIIIGQLVLKVFVKFEGKHLAESHWNMYSILSNDGSNSGPLAVEYHAIYWISMDLLCWISFTHSIANPDVLEIKRVPSCELITFQGNLPRLSSRMHTKYCRACNLSPWFQHEKRSNKTASWRYIPFEGDISKKNKRNMHNLGTNGEKRSKHPGLAYQVTVYTLEVQDQTKNGF